MNLESFIALQNSGASLSDIKRANAMQVIAAQEFALLQTDAENQVIMQEDGLVPRSPYDLLHVATEAQGGIPWRGVALGLKLQAVNSAKNFGEDTAAALAAIGQSTNSVLLEFWGIKVPENIPADWKWTDQEIVKLSSTRGGYAWDSRRQLRRFSISTDPSYTRELFNFTGDEKNSVRAKAQQQGLNTLRDAVTDVVEGFVLERIDKDLAAGKITAEQAQNRRTITENVIKILSYATEWQKPQPKVNGVPVAATVVQQNAAPSISELENQIA